MLFRSKRLLVSICGRRDGLIVSVTRQLAAGPLDENGRRESACAKKVLATLLNASKPGAPGAALFDAAVAVCREAGFPEAIVAHHQGGPTGYLNRDWKIGPGEKRTLVENQALAYNPTAGAFKAEETALMTDGGFEILTGPKDWPAVVVDGVRMADVLVR